MLQDLRVSLRLLWKDKAFTTTAALTLALCIGANTALFSVVHNVLLRPLPMPESRQIVSVENIYPLAGSDAFGQVGAPDYFERARVIKAYEISALYRGDEPSLDQSGSPVRLHAQSVTPSFFRLLRTPAALGRTFTDQEGEIGHEQKVVLSHALWQRQFGGDPKVIGATLRLDSRPHTIVGVMPREFWFIDPDVMLWTPLAFTADQKADSSRHNNNWREIARLKPGATLEQVQAEIDALNTANLDRFPQYKQLLVDAGFRTRTLRLQDQLVREVKASLYLMWGGALFVLLTGCVNVANLVLVRSRARLKDLATRLALGAGRGRITRQLITEHVLLLMLSAVAGLAVGYGALRLLGTLNIQELPRGSEIAMDNVVVAATLAMAALIGIALGLIPVAYALPANLTTVLREEGRSGTAARGARNARRVLVVAQVAFAFILLIGAGLLFTSFRRVLAVDPGFTAEGVMTASIYLPPARYKDDAAVRTFTEEALRRLRAQPGVTAVGATNTIPFGDNHSDSVTLAEGYQMSAGESVISPAQVTVTPGYFEAMRVRLVSGRFLTDADRAGGLRTIVIDEKLARKFWPGKNPVGRRMYQPSDINNILAITDKTVFLTIVGVVQDVKLRSITEGAGAVGTIFYPMAQEVRRDMTFALKTAGNPAALSSAIRGVISSIDRELPVSGMQSMTERTEKSLVTRRSPVVLSLSFGVVALFLSAIGIYGVLAYLVTQRRKEIGIRLALGSSSGAIFELVLREGLVLIGAGLALGAVGAALLRRSLESQLFGVRATDPIVLATVTLVLGAVAILACAVPARRATRIDPIVALSD